MHWAIDPRFFWRWRDGAGGTRTRSGLDSLRAGILFLLVLTTVLASQTHGQERAEDRIEPFLRVEAGGPQSYVTSLAFDPTGDILYAAGWDKVVYVWKRDTENSRYTLQPNATLRLPIGPGLLGAINTMAVSDDGRWLAVGGHGIFQGAASFRQPGRVVSSASILTPEMRRDEGLIYVFDTHQGTSRQLRGHAGSVVSLSFVSNSTDSPVLVSAAREWSEGGNGSGSFTGYVRVWNLLATEGEETISAVKFPEPANRRPGLAARRIGPDIKQIEVGLSSGDDRYRLWNVSTDRVQESACGKYGTTIAFSSSTDSFVTGSLESEGSSYSGRLDLRRPVKVEQRRTLAVAQATDYLIPRSLAIRGTGVKEAVAVVSRPLARTGQLQLPNRFVLQLVSLMDGKFGESQGPCTLWDVSATGAVPAVAASASGEIVAVAGGPDHSVWLFHASDIRNGGKPSQILQNAGSSWQHVSFVTRQQHPGLKLRNHSSEIVFDLFEQTVGEGTRGWVDNSPRAGEWRIQPQKQAGEPLAIVRGKQRVASLAVPEGEAVSAYAILPQGNATNDSTLRPGIVAVASHRLGQATLRLYNARTGEPFRQLTGHTQVIDSLAFDQSGRLLASVAADQTVCVWDLTDWDTIVGQHGAIPGTVVRKLQQGERSGMSVVAISMNAPTAVQDNLAAGDVIHSATMNGESRQWSSVRDFSDTFWALVPGTKVNLSVERRGQRRTVSLPIGQGIDERKPMFSLFFAAAKGDQPRHWIAWTPIGPYEASSREAEQFLGWHFNLEQGNATRFAPASEYRQTYYREGLVKELVELGSLQNRRIERPTAVSIGFGDEAQQEWTSGESIIIRQPPRTMHVFVADLPSKYIESLDIVVGDKTIGGVTRTEENEWVADVSQIAWGPGKHHCQFVIHTKEIPSQEFTFDETVQFIPPRPILRSDVATEQVVETAMFRFIADVEARGSEPVTIRFAQNGQLTDPITINDKTQQVEREFELQPGDNSIEILAQNQGTPEELLANETTRKVFRVTYRKAKALPPKLSLVQFSVFDGKSGKWQPIEESTFEDSLVVTQSQLTVKGTIQADVAPSSAEWRRADDANDSAERQPLKIKSSSDSGEVGDGSGREREQSPGKAGRPEGSSALGPDGPSPQNSTSPLPPGEVGRGSRREKEQSPGKAGRPEGSSALGPDGPSPQNSTSPLPPGEVGRGSGRERAPEAQRQTWTFSQTIDLKPGPQQLSFFARSADSDEAMVQVAVDFRPPLPEIVWSESDESGFIERDALEPRAEIELSGKLVLSDSSYPFEARVLNNDAVAGTVDVDLERAVFSAKVALNGGENRIRVALKNAWQPEKTTAVRVWQYRRLPTVSKTTHSDVQQKPFVDVTATIQSPVERPPTHLTVGDRPVELDAIRMVSSDEGVGTWEASVAEIPLRPGKNNIPVVAANADGKCRTPAIVEVDYQGTYWNPPQIDFVNAGPSESVTAPEFELLFNVQSPTILRNVRVEQNGVALPNEKLTIGEPTQSESTSHWQVATRLDLSEGLNNLTVTVQNEGGEVRAQRVLNFVPPPVTLEIVSLEPDGQPDKVIRPTVGSDGRLVFTDPLPSGNGRLKGTVRWSRSNTARPSATELRIWANGFQQAPVVLKGGDEKQEFSAVVVLGEEKNNLISLDLAGAPLDTSSRTSVVVDCLRPQAAQRLHLMIVGVDQTDADAIMQRALTAVRAEVDGSGKFREPLRAAGFYRINAYKPLIGKVTFSNVFRLLLQVKSDLKLPLAPNPAGQAPLAVNDVVIVYYEGGILIPEKQHFFLCTSERFDPKNRYSAIGSDWLTKFFDSMRGAQLAFIDVAADRPPIDIPVSDWSHDSHAALLCYAWQRGFTPPENMRLLKAVDQALGTAVRLSEVDAELAKLSQTSAELDYNRVVPEGLKSLILSGQ